MTWTSRLFAPALVLGALLGAAAWGYAQGTAAAAQAGSTRVLLLSGADIGFQLVGQRNGKAIGRLVVRIDGEWQEAQFDHTVTPLK